MRGPVAVLLLSALALTGCASAGPTVTSPTTPSNRHQSTPAEPFVSESWTGYHSDQARTGSVMSTPPREPTVVDWTAALGGAVYGQPVFAHNRVIAATENNRVSALNAGSGAVEWTVSLGPPLTHVAELAGCGDIDPLGITSTPAVDLTTGTVYVVGEVFKNGAVHHQLEGVAIDTGKVLLSESVDPPLPAGENPRTLLQRAGLAIANGRVYIGFGGNAGDCGSYHGWVVSVKETGPARLQSFEVAADGQGGAIWEAGGAPAVDSHGNVYVTTGNANPDPPQGGPDPRKYTESVVKLSPGLVPLAAFKDVVAGGDEDLATGNPVLLPHGLVFAIGKTDVAYILKQSDLSQVAAIPGVCGSDPDGGPAFDPATDRIYVPCRGGGIQQLDLATKTVGPKFPGANAAPLLIGSTLWAALYPNGTLTEVDTTTGAVTQTLAVGSTVPHFVTPSTAGGMLFLGTDRGVVAFG
ncbi:MAG TPA: PQQ-binding-like beta-propeller repeat protein [Pseudolysinimonas sp.]